MLRVRQALRTAVDERTRWPVLDGFRGLAIVAVVAYHAFKIVGGWTAGKIRGDGVPWYWWPLGGGRLGVDLFFVLSGFLLLFSWRSIRRRQPHLRGALREYAKGRLIRIAPPYYVMLAVYIPLIAPSLLRSAEGLWDVFLFFSFQQFNEPSLPGQVNVALWTLTVEVQFYVVLPVVAFLIARARPATPLLAALALSLWWADHRGVYPTSWLLGRSDQFVAGMALASLVSDALAGRAGWVIRIVRQRWAPWALAIPAAVLWLYHGSTLGLPRGHRYDDWVHPALGVALALIVAHLVTNDRPGWLHRVQERAGPRLLGHLSYGIYLWHFPIYDRMLDWTGGAGAGIAAPGAILGLLLATLATLAISALSYAWIERPFLERKVRSSVTAPSPGTAVAPAAGGS